MLGGERNPELNVGDIFCVETVSEKVREEERRREGEKERGRESEGRERERERGRMENIEIRGLSYFHFPKELFSKLTRTFQKIVIFSPRLVGRISRQTSKSISVGMS
jgi:hypothetical protein